jgi:aldehyde:ferredoxin oxidoreductase
VQEGLKTEDDRLPKRLHKEALKTGHALSEEELEKMVADYYQLRGWDEQGCPPIR